MARVQRRLADFRFVLAGMLALALVAPAAADEPDQQPSEKAKPTPVPGSLAAAAAGLKLQQPGDGSGGSMVITDQNLREKGAGASVSQGSSAAPAGAANPAAPTAGAAGAQTAPAAGNDLASQLLAQQAKVDELEARLAAMDEKLAEPSPDPRYPKYNNAPQFRAPGQVDPAQGERDQVASQLEKERARLAALRAQGDKAGISVRKVPNDAPTKPAD